MTLNLAAFRARRALEFANVAGVGLALAAATAAVLGRASHQPHVAVASVPSTLVLGALWAWMLRSRNRAWLRGQRVRQMWLGSVPFAALNAALAAGICFGWRGPAFELGSFLGGALAGATLGGLVWVPALAATLACFGAPIAWAERRADQGLAGREAGEVVVGGASAVVALGALAVALPGEQYFVEGVDGAVWLTRGLAAAGAAAGLAAAATAFARGRARRRFVAAVEAGEVEHFRVESTPEGRALVRVVTPGTHYRVADYQEEVARLDAAGEVTRAS